MAPINTKSAGETSLVRSVLVPATPDAEEFFGKDVGSAIGSNRFSMGNGFLEAEWRLSPFLHLSSLGNRMSGNEFPFVLREVFRLTTDGGTLGPENLNLLKVEEIEEPEAVHFCVRFEGKGLELELHIRLGVNRHFLQQWLCVHSPAESIRLREVNLLALEATGGGPVRVVHLNQMDESCGAAFLPGEEGGLFSCIEFPYYQTEVNDQSIFQGYQLSRIIEPEGAYKSQILTLGVFRNEEGSEAWFREYLAATDPPFKEIPTLLHHGFGQGDLFPWSESLERYYELEDELDLSIIYFAGSGNVANRSLEAREPYREGLKSLTKRGKRPVTNVGWSPRREGTCFVERVQEMEILVEGLAEMGYRVINHDGLNSPHCRDGDCSHDPEDPVQRFQDYEGLIGVFRKAAAAGIDYQEGHIGFWSLGPFAARELSVIHAYDWQVFPQHLSAGQAIFETWLDKTKTSYKRYLLPIYKYRGQVSYYRLWEEDKHPLPAGDVIVSWNWNRQDGGFHDAIGWRNALVGAMAMGVNFNFSYLAPDILEEDLAFTRKWLEWEKDHVEELLRLRLCADDPLVDVISKTGKNGGFVFCMNRDWLDRTVEVEIALPVNTWEVKEIYPIERFLGGSASGNFESGESIRLHLAPKSVVVLELRPAAADGSVRVFGAKVLTTRENDRGGIEADLSIPVDIPKTTIGFRSEGRLQDIQVDLSQRFYVPGLVDWAREGETFVTSFTLPEVQTAGQDSDEAVPATVRIVDELSETADRLVRQLLDLPTTGDLNVDTWRMYPWAFANKVYLVLEFDSAPEVSEEHLMSPRVGVNGQDVTVAPKFRFGRGEEDLLLSNFFFSDVTQFLRSGSENRIEVTPPDGIKLVKGAISGIPPQTVQCTIELDADKVLHLLNS